MCKALVTNSSNLEKPNFLKIEGEWHDEAEVPRVMHIKLTLSVMFLRVMSNKGHVGLFHFLLQVFKDSATTYMTWRCALSIMVFLIGIGISSQSSKSLMTLFMFHFVPTPSGKSWIHLFFFQLWVNSWTDWVLQPCSATSLERKLWIQTYST